MTRRHNQEKMSVLKRAIKHYGKRNQVQKAIEEMAELINELCKEQIGRSSKEKVAEEMADVIIMLWQLEMIFKNGGRDHANNKLQIETTSKKNNEGRAKVEIIRIFLEASVWNNVKEDVCISHDGKTDTIYIRKRSKRLPQTITAAEMMALMTDLGYIQGE